MRKISHWLSNIWEVIVMYCIMHDWTMIAIPLAAVVVFVPVGILIANWLAGVLRMVTGN